MLTTRIYAWTRAHATLVDAVIALGILLTFGVVGAASGVGILGGLFSVVTIALLAVRRRWPVAVMLAMLVLGLLQVAIVPTLMPANIAQLYVVYTVAAHVPSFRTRLVALGLGVLGAFLGSFRLGGTREPLEIAFTTFSISVAVVLVWVVGNIIRGRESIIEQLSESNRVLQRDRDQRDQIAAQHERARIAREMHDIVAHSLSVVVVQADGGAYAAEHAARWERTDATRTLETIGTTARSALSETRRLVGVLREEGGAADLSPLAGLADLDSLVEGVRSSGLAVRCDTVPAASLVGLPRDVDLAAYRVIQESLTNVLKHAGPGATADVVVEWLPGALRISVSDDGLGAAAGDDGEGNGVVGMRERVQSSGGTIVVGPRPQGGFAVTATLPLEGHGPPPAAPAPADATHLVPADATQLVPADATQLVPTGSTREVPLADTRLVPTPTAQFWSGGPQ